MAAHKKKKTNAKQQGRYKSGLEQKIADQIEANGLNVRYEELVIPFIQPERTRKYKPDFILPSGIILEVKGRFDTDDRTKMKMVRDSNQHLDIRLVFQNANAKISKKSRTSYADWCEHNGFRWADKGWIPKEWIEER